MPKRKTTSLAPGIFIAGVGASAGVEALRELIAHLQINQRIAYVIAQHLSPTHQSMLKTLLARESKLRVEELKYAQVPLADTIYITPPNTDVEINNGIIRLYAPLSGAGPKPNVNRFFSSRARNLGCRSIGIILSGTGGDGTTGLNAVKNAGGVTIVQDPATAKFDGMPNSAIESFDVEIILPPARIGRMLQQYALTGVIEKTADPPPPGDVYSQISATVREKTGIELAQYKSSIIERQIKRRLGLHRSACMDDYARMLQEDGVEARQLAKDVLISFTGFFRDKAAFDELKKVVGRLVGEQDAKETLRIWVPGSATGEEAYSIAVLCAEAQRELENSGKFVIFATDIDGHATARARVGRYPKAALDAAAQSCRDRYFESSGVETVAVKSLRDNIMFSAHDLVKDPPYSHIDLISCRNVLNYLAPPLQKCALEILHYALKDNGVLFFGKSETVNRHQSLFRPLSKKNRIYKKIGHSVLLRLTNGPAGDRLQGMERPLRHDVKETVSQSIYAALGKAYAPPSVLINGGNEVVHSTEGMEHFLKWRSGPSRLNIYDLLEDSLRAEMRALICKCRRELKPVTGGRALTTVDGKAASYRIAVRPLGNEADTLVLASFEQTPDPVWAVPPSVKDTAAAGHLIILELEHELTATREHLQTVVEELETSNEELQSVNAALQSANKVLQTSNEDLQSTNEELLKVIDELQVKSHALENTAVDLQNVQDSIDFPLFVVDRDLRVSRFVPAAQQLVPLPQMLPGESITAFPWSGEIKDLRRHVEQVIQSGESFQSDAKVGEQFYLLRMVPCRLKTGQISGAILMLLDTTVLQRAKNRLQERERYLQLLVDHMLDGVVTMDERGLIQSFNTAAEKMFGFAAAEVIGHKINILMPAKFAKAHDSYIQNYLVTGMAGLLGGQREVQGIRKDGGVFPLEISVSEMMCEHQRLFIGLVRDVTARRQAEDALYREKEKALITLHSIGDGVVTANNAMVVEYMNPVAERLTGWRLEQAAGLHVSRVLKVLDELTHEPAPELLEVAETAVQVSARDTLLRSRGGEEYSIELSASAIRGRAGNKMGLVVTFRDVSDKREMVRQMSWQARHDALTGLANRQEMEHRLEAALTSAKSCHREHALLYLDLDQFKVVNDTCGHRAGDELLRLVANQIAGALRKRDTLSRLGGDEFGVLLENCGLSQAETIAEKIQMLVDEFRFTWSDKIFKIGASIGVVAIVADSQDIASLLSDADAACYAAKENGRNRVQVHTPTDKDIVRRRTEMNWVSNLNKVLDENRFQLYFQPIHSMRHDGVQSHWEVLLRMRDEEGRLILPSVFLAAAERYGLMRSIDRWVVRTALITMAQLAQNRNERSNTVIAVNLSASSIVDGKFLGYVKEQLATYKIDPGILCFEITETTAITNFVKAKEFMHALKKAGCKFALDDFGSGMSSFGYLKSLPVDFIKIDGSFVRDIAHDVVDFAMVESINRLGHLMDKQTVAECAENQVIIDKLKTIGVDFVQGFGIRKPIPLQEFLFAEYVN